MNRTSSWARRGAARRTTALKKKKMATSRRASAASANAKRREKIARKPPTAQATRARASRRCPGRASTKSSRFTTFSPSKRFAEHFHALELRQGPSAPLRLDLSAFVAGASESRAQGRLTPAESSLRFSDRTDSITLTDKSTVPIKGTVKMSKLLPPDPTKPGAQGDIAYAAGINVCRHKIAPRASGSSPTDDGSACACTGVQQCGRLPLRHCTTKTEKDDCRVDGHAHTKCGTDKRCKPVNVFAAHCHRLELRVGAQTYTGPSAP